MKILDDLLASLDDGAPVRDIRLGPFQTAVVSRYCGLASTVQDDDRPHGKVAVQEAGHLTEKSAGELARLALSASPLEASLGMATVNSLIAVDERECTERNAADLLVEKGKGKRVALVGHFPFVPAVRRALGDLWVIEQHPREGDFPAAEADRLLPRADVIGITGTTFTNHTLEHLLGLCPRGAYVILLGSTVPFSKVLFDYGISALSGVKVMDTGAALHSVSEGANARQLAGIRRLTLQKDGQ